MGDVVPLSAAELRRLIQEVPDLPREPVEVPCWGVTVWVRGMTGRERDEYEESLVVVEGKGKRAERKLRFRDARARMVAMCTTDAEGNRIFMPEDVSWLTNKSASALNLLWERIRVLSGLTVADEQELGAEEDEDDSEGGVKNP